MIDKVAESQVDQAKLMTKQTSNVLRYSLWMEGPGGDVFQLIDADIECPVSRTIYVTTVEDGQDSVQITLLWRWDDLREGEPDDSWTKYPTGSWYRVAGCFVVSGVRKGFRGEVKIALKIAVMADGEMLNTEAKLDGEALFVHGSRRSASAMDALPADPFELRPPPTDW